jgi:hypothetical protein
MMTVLKLFGFTCSLFVVQFEVFTVDSFRDSCELAGGVDSTLRPFFVLAAVTACDTAIVVIVAIIG